MRTLLGRKVVAFVVLAMIAAIFLMPLSIATHWIPDTEVSVSPPQTKASRTVDFEVRVQNGGTATLTVCTVDIAFQWNSNTWRIFSGTEEIPSGGSRAWMVSEAVPALQPGFYRETVTVSAMSSTDPLPVCMSNEWIGNVEIVANGPPVAAFTFSPSDGDTTTTVQFSDESLDPDGTVASWRWDFGDGSTSNLRNPTHRFVSPGLFPVELTVTDDDGGTNSVTRNVQVVAPPLGGGPRISGLGAAEWFIVVAAVVVASVLLARIIRRKRSPRKWGK